MAHKKGVGSTDNGRDSNSKRLGVKLFGGQVAKVGNIIVRQRGTRFHAGENVYMGKDFTLHAGVEGKIAFKRRAKNRIFISVVPSGEVVETVAEAVKPKAAPAPKTAEVAAPAPEAKKAAPKKETPKAAPAPKAKKEATEKAATKKAAPKAKKAEKGTKADDFRKIEGVGPKIAGLLNDAGIVTFVELAATDADKIKEILAAAGNRYKMHDPTTWPKQADFAANGKWEELKKWQDELDGGK